MQNIIEPDLLSRFVMYVDSHGHGQTHNIPVVLKHIHGSERSIIEHSLNKALVLTLPIKRVLGLNYLSYYDG